MNVRAGSLAQAVQAQPVVPEQHGVARADVDSQHAEHEHEHEQQHEHQQGHDAQHGREHEQDTQQPNQRERLATARVEEENARNVNLDRRRALARAALKVQTIFGGLNPENESCAIARAAELLSTSFARPLPEDRGTNSLAHFIAENLHRDRALVEEVCAHFARHFLDVQTRERNTPLPATNIRSEVDDVLELRANRGYQRYPQLGPTVKVPLAPTMYRALYPHIWVMQPSAAASVAEWKMELDSICAVAMFGRPDKRQDIIELRTAAAAWMAEAIQLQVARFDDFPASHFESGFLHFKRLAYNVAMLLGKDITNFREVVNTLLQGSKAFTWNEVFDKLKPSKGSRDFSRQPRPQHDAPIFQFPSQGRGRFRGRGN